MQGGAPQQAALPGSGETCGSPAAHSARRGELLHSGTCKLRQGAIRGPGRAVPCTQGSSAVRLHAAGSDAVRDGVADHSGSRGEGGRLLHRESHGTSHMSAPSIQAQCCVLHTRPCTYERRSGCALCWAGVHQAAVEGPCTQQPRLARCATRCSSCARVFVA